MKVKQFYPCFLLFGFFYLFVGVESLNAQKYVQNIYESLGKVNINYEAFSYHKNEATDQSLSDTYYIQEVAYANGYYYVRSRPTTDNTETLLVIDEDSEEVVQIIDLESYHPGGIQIYDSIFAIPFAITGQTAKINFYSLSNLEPLSLLSSYTTNLENSYCLGITEYDGKYLVANYYSRFGNIRFYHFDSFFNKVAENTWRFTNQDLSNLYPFTSWRNESYNYGTMSLVKSIKQGSRTPNYFMIMYHKTNIADVF